MPTRSDREMEKSEPKNNNFSHCSKFFNLIYYGFLYRGSAAYVEACAQSTASNKKRNLYLYKGM
jgi:hypothetical protein